MKVTCWKFHIKTFFTSLCEQPYFLFPNVLKRWSFQKNRTGIWSFLCYQERWCFFFPKIWSYSLDTKGKMIFLKKKNTWKYDIIFKCSEKMVFLKNSCLNMIFFVISGKMVFLFSKKYDNFSLGGKWKKMIFINAWKYDIFCMYAWALQTWHCPPGKKTKMPRKNTPKGDISGITKKDDIHSRFILDSSYFCWNTTFIYTLERAQEAATKKRSVSIRKGLLRTFAKVIGKDLCQTLLF